MKDPLKKLSIAVTGDFGEGRTHEKIRQWVEANGGRLATSIDATVTHLVCSKDHFKKSNTMVQQARKFKGVKIVNFDWLEDSLMSHSPKRVAMYEMKRQVKCAVKAKTKKKIVRKQKVKEGVKAFVKGCADFKDDMLSDGYQIYRDSTGFSYDVTLARADLTNNKNERYYLKVGSLLPPVFPSYPPSDVRAFIGRPRLQRVQLYETHSVPKYYSAYVKYSSPNKKCGTQMLCPIGSTFDAAMSNFQGFFLLKTRKRWDQRLLGTQTEGDAFTYSPPAAGQPRGEMPNGFW